MNRGFITLKNIPNHYSSVILKIAYFSLLLLTQFTAIYCIQNYLAIKQFPKQLEKIECQLATSISKYEFDGAHINKQILKSNLNESNITSILSEYQRNNFFYNKRDVILSWIEKNQILNAYGKIDSTTLPRKKLYLNKCSTIPGRLFFSSPYRSKNFPDINIIHACMGAFSKDVLVGTIDFKFNIKSLTEQVLGRDNTYNIIILNERNDVLMSSDHNAPKSIELLQNHQAGPLHQEIHINNKLYTQYKNVNGEPYKILMGISKDALIFATFQAIIKNALPIFLINFTCFLLYLFIVMIKRYSNEIFFLKLDNKKLMNDFSNTQASLTITQEKFERFMISDIKMKKYCEALGRKMLKLMSNTIKDLETVEQYFSGQSNIIISPENIKSIILTSYKNLVTIVSIKTLTNNHEEVDIVNILDDCIAITDKFSIHRNIEVIRCTTNPLIISLVASKTRLEQLILGILYYCISETPKNVGKLVLRLEENVISENKTVIISFERETFDFESEQNDIPDVFSNLIKLTLENIQTLATLEGYHIEEERTSRKIKKITLIIKQDSKQTNSDDSGEKSNVFKLY